MLVLDLAVLFVNTFGFLGSLYLVWVLAKWDASYLRRVWFWGLILLVGTYWLASWSTGFEDMSIDLLGVLASFLLLWVWAHLGATCFTRIWVWGLILFVGTFWLAPWPGMLGKWRATHARLHVAGIPREVRALPEDQRPRARRWAEVMTAETGVRAIPVDSSIVWRHDYEMRFRETMEARIKEQFGQDIYLRVAKKARALEDAAPAPSLEATPAS